MVQLGVVCSEICLLHTVVFQTQEICNYFGMGMETTPQHWGTGFFIAGIKLGSNRVCLLPSNVVFWCVACYCNSPFPGHKDAFKSTVTVLV